MPSYCCQLFRAVNHVALVCSLFILEAQFLVAPLQSDLHDSINKRLWILLQLRVEPSHMYNVTCSALL